MHPPQPAENGSTEAAKEQTNAGLENQPPAPMLNTSSSLVMVNGCKMHEAFTCAFGTWGGLTHAQSCQMRITTSLPLQGQSRDALVQDAERLRRSRLVFWWTSLQVLASWLRSRGAEAAISSPLDNTSVTFAAMSLGN